MAGAYLGAEKALVDQWIEDRLGANPYAASLDAVQTGLSAKVFPDVAPATSTYPFIVYQSQTPPRDIRGTGTARVMVEGLYVIKAVAQGTDFMLLKDVAKVIDAAFTIGQPITIGTDGYIMSSVREEQFSLVTVEEGTQFRHLGGVFRILAQAV